MDAKMCDRCRKLYQIYHKTFGYPPRNTVVECNGVELMDDNTGVGKIDLCPGCLADFGIFMGLGKSLDKTTKT